MSVTLPIDVIRQYVRDRMLSSCTRTTESSQKSRLSFCVGSHAADVEDPDDDPMMSPVIVDGVTVEIIHRDQRFIIEASIRRSLAGAAVKE